MKRDYQLFIEDILDCINKIDEFVVKLISLNSSKTIKRAARLSENLKLLEKQLKMSLTQ